MRKTDYLLIWMLLLLLPSCSKAESDNKDSILTGNEKILVTYFSYSGNTRQVAEQITQLTSGDSFQVLPVNPYPEDYDECVLQARRERESNYHPPLQSKVENLEDYDIIFVGFPIWATTISQPTLSFLTENDFSGKIVIPFCTHAGYGRGKSFTTVAELCPNSTILDGFDIEGDDVKDVKPLLEEWLKKIEILK